MLGCEVLNCAFPVNKNKRVFILSAILPIKLIRKTWFIKIRYYYISKLLFSSQATSTIYGKVL